MMDPSVSKLWYQLEQEETKVILERKRLQEIWQKIAAMHSVNEAKRAAFEREAEFGFVPSSTRIVLNVGGQIFESTAEVLCRDRFSLLAALCKASDAPISRDETGAFFLDRDWWIFRYILQFLRSGALPSDPALLQEMYAEAAFYRVGSLRRAIESKMQAAGREPHPADSGTQHRDPVQTFRDTKPSAPLDTGSYGSDDFLEQRAPRHAAYDTYTGRRKF